MLLPAVTAFSVKAATQRYAECARAMGIASAANDEAVDTLITALYCRNEELQVPSPEKYGISEESYFSLIPVMSAQAMASGSPQNNPRVPTIEEIGDLYRQVWA
jgi:alcohol dehydrogenase class IV